MCQFHVRNFEMARAVLTKLLRFLRSRAGVGAQTCRSGSASLRQQVRALYCDVFHAFGISAFCPLSLRLRQTFFPTRCHVKLSRPFVFCIVLAATAAAAQNPPAAVPAARSTLPDRVVNLLREANLPQDALGVMVLRASDGATVLAHRANEPMQPASTLKTLTSIVALERLGPSYRGKTELRSAAELTAGTLTGDVVLRGLGDPDFDWQALQGMLQSLRFSGVHVINGDLVLDRSYFQPSRPDADVPPFDESPEFRYNLIPDALLLNSNLLRLEIVSDESGMRVGVTPALDRVSVHSEMKIVDTPCADWEDFWTLPHVKKADDGRIRVTLRGEFPRNCPVTTAMACLIAWTLPIAFSVRCGRVWAARGRALPATALERRIRACWQHISRERSLNSIAIS